MEMRKKLTKGCYVEILRDNLRGFTIQTNSDDVIIKYNDEYSIATIIIGDKFKLKLGDTIEIDGYTYTVNIIQQLDDIFYCIQEPITKTTQFVLPMLGKRFDYYDSNKNLYNTYISDCYTFIYLVYKFTPDEEYIELEDKLTKHKCYRETLDPSPELVVMKFEIPEKYWNDVKLIMEGKYSSISIKTKNMIYMFHGLTTSSRTYNTLYNKSKYREQLEEELDCIIPEDVPMISKPELNKEIYKECLKSTLVNVGTID